jgi:hypothetical protein
MRSQFCDQVSGVSGGLCEFVHGGDAFDLHDVERSGFNILLR